MKKIASSDSSALVCSVSEKVPVHIPKKFFAAETVSADSETCGMELTSSAVYGRLSLEVLPFRFSWREIARPLVKELFKTQIVDDEFDGSSLLKCAQQHRVDGDIKILVVKPTPFWVKKLNLKDAESIDAQRNLIGCMVDTKSEKLLATQLFSFGRMSDTTIGKFGDNDRFVLTT